MRLGWMLLLLTVIIICLSTLGVLCLSTARVRLVQADRQAAQAQSVYALECAGQDWLAALDASLAAGGALPPDSVREGSRISTVRQDGARTLSIAVELTGNGGYRVVEWKQQAARPGEEDAPVLFGSEEMSGGQDAPLFFGAEG